MVDANTLIHESLERAGELCPDLTPKVYEQLFNQHPDLKSKFIMDKNHAVKGEMLSKAFEAIIDLTGAELYARTLIHAEAINHDNNFGITKEVFVTFFPIVRDTVRNVLGGNWTAETDQAWSQLLEKIDGLIRRAGS